MSAEQHKSLREQLFLRIPDKIRRIFFTRIRQFDAAPAFEKYFSDVNAGVESGVAKKRMLRLLEASLRSFTQEGIGKPEINEYGFQITQARFVHELHEDTDRVVLRSLLYNDTAREQKEKLLSEENPILRERYLEEFASWEHIWATLLPEIETLLHLGSETTIARLKTKGFHRRIFDPSLEHSDPKKNAFSPNRLCDVTAGLQALFPSLEGKSTIEIYEHPQKYSFVSPRFSFYHQGETSIARIMRLVYIPCIDTFTFLESGLFTAYTNTEISYFLQLDDREEPPNFDTPRELLQMVSVLTAEFSALAPHAVFHTIIDKLGHFPEIPVGENVIREGVRDLRTQLQYLERIFAFEERLMAEHPTTRHRLSQRLELASQPILHSLLRAKELDVDGQVQNYVQMFSDIALAQNPRAASKKFQAGVLAVHPDFATKVLSVIDCGTGTILGGVNGAMPGLEMGLSTEQLFGRIRDAELKDIESWDELVEFCKPFGIPPEWFHRNTGGEKCINYHETDRNWIGSCHMCPQCNARFNMDHGLIPSGQDGETAVRSSSASPIDALTGGGNYAVDSLSLGDIPVVLTSGFQPFMVDN